MVASSWREQVHSLWFLLDSTLPQETQVASTARSAYFHLWLVCQLWPVLDTDDNLATVLHALLTSTLDYSFPSTLGVCKNAGCQSHSRAVLSLFVIFDSVVIWISFGKQWMPPSSVKSWRGAHQGWGTNVALQASRNWPSELSPSHTPHWPSFAHWVFLPCWNRFLNSDQDT